MFLRLLAVASCLAVAACGGGSATGVSPAAPASPAGSKAAALASGCFGCPGTEFSPSNSASVRTFLGPGDAAVEFTLRDIEGQAVSLSSLLASRPVLLVHGSFT